jgi:hypothetical protein
MKGGAAGELAIVFCKEEATVGRGVVSGEACQFFVETLEAQAEAERFAVYEEEFAGLGDLGGSLCLGECQHC